MSSIDPSLLSDRLFELAETVEPASVDERIPDDIDRTRRRTASPPPVRRKPDHECMAFLELTRLGGRPACSIDTFKRIRENPEQYQEILDPWQPELGTGSILHSEIKLFSEQLSRWKLFRVWQYKSRGLDPPPELSSFQIDSSLTEDLLSDDDFEDSTMSEARDRYQILMISKCIKAERANHGAGLSGYADEAQARLRRHRIHRSFLALSDPTEQSRLSTWLEYIAFETWWLDTHTALRESDESHVEQGSETLSKEDELGVTQECEQNHDSTQTRETLSATGYSDYNAVFQQATQTVVKDEIARSQRIVDWALAELENIEWNPQPESVRPKPPRRNTSPLVSALRMKRKREDQAGTVSPSPITPAPSFPWDARSEENKSKRRRTTDSGYEGSTREGNSELPPPLSPAASPRPIDDSACEKESRIMGDGVKIEDQSDEQST